MLRVLRRIEKLEEIHSVGAVQIQATLYFIDSDGVVGSILRMSEGKREWIRGAAEVAKAESLWTDERRRQARAQRRDVKHDSN